MNEITLALIVYGLLQVGSLALLPRWWKIAALPSLYVVLPICNYFRTGGGYMGNAFVIMFCIYACAYLGGGYNPRLEYSDHRSRKSRGGLAGVRYPPARSQSPCVSSTSSFSEEQYS